VLLKHEKCYNKYALLKNLNTKKHERIIGEFLLRKICSNMRIKKKNERGINFKTIFIFRKKFAI